MKTTITVYELAAALLCTDRNVRKREGESLPAHIDGSEPRSYVLADVLWIVNGQEREQICRALKLDAAQIRGRMTAETSASAGYVPGVDDDD